MTFFHKTSAQSQYQDEVLIIRFSLPNLTEIIVTLKYHQMSLYWSPKPRGRSPNREKDRENRENKQIKG